VPEGLIMEFERRGREECEAVNERLGVDPDADATNWPDGLRRNAAGGTATSWVAFEIWASVDAQQPFSDDRLSPALQAVGFPGPPSRVEWIDLAVFWAAPEA
jgi:hypothetical protein